VQIVKKLLFASALLAIVPASAYAQASITGVVKDTSGAVLPGVTVEASSPVLIEKVRAAVTDGSGQYRIVDLRAGIYDVTFSLTGFSTVKREGVELSGSFTASINADMKVGALTETITVTGETPIVDTQSVRRQTTMTNDLISAMPAARSYAGVMMLIPSTTMQAGTALDIQVTPGMLVFGGAGGRSNESRIQVDGLNTGAAFNGAGVSSYVPDISNAQEIATTTSGGMGEAEVGGPSFSIVPKTGGNTFKGSFYASNVTSGMVSDNYTDDLKARGLTTPGALQKVWDYNVGLGGPIRKDRAWFFAQARDEGSHRTVPGMFANANFGDPTKWTYVADTSHPAVQAGSWRTGSVRLTVQPTTRNKFNLFWDEQQPCQGAATLGSTEGCRQSGPNEVICGAPGSSNPSCSATSAPETGTYLHPYGQRVQQATWTSPVSNRLLLEAGVGTYLSRWGGSEQPGNLTRDLVRVTEQCTAGCASNGGIANLAYRSQNWAANWQGTHSWRASASYVSGAQSMKFGYQGGYLVANSRNFQNNTNTAYRFNNGIPNQITETITPVDNQARLRYDSLYAQEQWTIGRVTVQGAVRYDRAYSWFPEVTVGPTIFLPTAVTYAETQGVRSYNDLTPRVGLAWDVFGTGKTSLKINAGKYLQAAQTGLTYSALQPSGRLSTSVTRTWTDANSNFRPDCNLQNPLVQDNRGAGGDFCAQISTLNFGKDVFTSDLDPALRSGYGVRPGDGQWGVSVQQQVLPRVSIEFGYNRRWLNNFTVVDNALNLATDYDPFQVTAPLDPRLPNGGGYVMSGLFNVNPTVASLTNNVTTRSENYGTQINSSHGILLNISARPRNGLIFQGGLSSGTTRTDSCEIRALLPETAATDPWCDTSTGWTTRYTGLGSYTLPKVDVLLSGTFRSDKGGQLAANWAASNAIIAASLGRNLSNNGVNATVNLIEPGTLYGDRVNEVDVRLAKILKFGRTRTNVGFDIYNILNSAAVLSYNQAFIPVGSASNPAGQWLVPTGVIQPRFWKFSAQIDF
jgi:Carboxypeptidase regulatory-like domain